MTQLETLDIEQQSEPAEVADPGQQPAGRFATLLAPTSPVPVIAGVVVVAIGFIVIAIGWAEIAGLTNVALQMPYLVSAGITGLGLVMVGLLIISVAVRRQDAAERRRQFEALTEALREFQGRRP